MKTRLTIAMLSVACLLLSMTGSVQAALLVEYRFNSDTSDSAGFAPGLDGILGGNAYVSGGVLQLDGDGDYMEIPQAAFSSLNPFDGTSDFSIHLRFKAAPNSKGGVLISSARNIDIDNHSMAMFLDGEGVERGVVGGVVYDNVFINGFSTSPPDLRDGVPHNLSLAYDAATPRLFMYVDGVIRGAKTFNPSIPNIEMDTVRIGDSLNTEFPALLFSPTDEFLGTIDNVRIYDSFVVPEPSTLTLAALALLGLVACGWRGRRNK